MVKIAIFATLAALTAAGAEKDITERVRKDHPRMFFNAESWKGIKERTENTEYGKAQLAWLMKTVSEYPSDPVCGNTGRVFTPPSQPISSVKEWGLEASNVALAWRFTRDGKYLELAKKMLERSAKAYNDALANDRGVHWYSFRRIMALCAYDWIYEGLTEEERKAIILPLMKHMHEVQPEVTKRQIIRRNTGWCDSGYYSVRCLKWFAGLAAFGDGFCDERAAEMLRKGYEEMLKMVEIRTQIAGDDGALAHGTTEYTMGAYPWAHFNFFHTMISACGENPAEKYLSMGLYPNWVWWTSIAREGGAKPMFHYGYGDCQHQDNFISDESLYEHLTHYMYFFKEADKDAARLAATLRPMMSNRDIGMAFPFYRFLLPGDMDVKPFSAAELKERKIGARHFSDVGQIFMRSGMDGDATYSLFTTGSKTIMHKHMDENNFVIYRNGFLALDSGSRGMETDTSLRYYYAQTVAHNCMLIHKPNEAIPVHWGLMSEDPEGKTNYGGQYLEVTATPLAFETNDEWTYVASDATKCYHEKSTECVRQYVFIMPDVFVVYDRVGAADASYRKEWLMHLQNEPQIDGRMVSAKCDNGEIFCEALLPSGATINKRGGKGKEFWSNGKNWELHPDFLKYAAKSAEETKSGPYFGNWRIEVSPKEAAFSDRFLNVITVGKAGKTKAAEAMTIGRGEKDGAAITLPDGRKVEILFNRVGKVGGTISIDGKTREFTDRVTEQKGICGL